MSQAAPRWTPVNIDRPPERRWRLPPRLAAIGLAVLVWAILVVAALLGVWLA